MTDHSDYIMAYLSDDMPAEEKKQFEARLAADEELHRQFQIWAKGVEYIKAKSMLEEVENDPDLPRAEAQVKEWFTGDEARKANSGPRLARRSLLGAFSASALVLVFLLLRSFTSPDPSRLYNQYYEPLSEDEIQLQVVRGSSDAYLQAGISFYLREEYDRACEVLEEASKYFTQIAGTSSSHKADAEKLGIRIEKLQATTNPQSSGRSGRHQKK